MYADYFCKMALLNIDQFTERTEKSVHVCPKCFGTMHQVALRWQDLCLAFVNSKKIMERIKCTDCKLELRIEKEV